MQNGAISSSNIDEVVSLLLSFESSTIKTHFLISQIYIRAGLGKKALNHLTTVKSSISANELDTSSPDVKKLNLAIDLCRNAVKSNSKSNIIANKIHEDFCL